MASEITLLAEVCGTLDVAWVAIWTVPEDTAVTIKSFRFCHRGEGDGIGVNFGIFRVGHSQAQYICNNIALDPYDTLHSEDGDEVFLNAGDMIYASAALSNRIDFVISIFSRPQLVGQGVPE